jgi:hypothetical protein
MPKQEFAMSDWRVAQGATEDVDPSSPLLKKPWTIAVTTNDGDIQIEANAPDGTKRFITIEIDNGNLIVRPYYDERLAEEPALTLAIGDDAVYVEQIAGAPFRPSGKPTIHLYRPDREVAAITPEFTPNSAIGLGIPPAKLAGIIAK